MIPALNVTAWSAQAPWPEPRQVEQDLIISRALVDIFNDELLRRELRFRGGTALNKLHFPAPLRYSEDIDLVRTTHGPIGPIFDRLRAVCEPWLGVGAWDMTAVAPKLRYSVPSEDNPAVTIKLKIEINTREVEAFDGELIMPFAVENPWFSGATEIPTFSREEMLATKLRALLQRDKGRDLFDLAHARGIFPDLDLDRVVDLFSRYLGEARITRPQAEQRMLGKLTRAAFMQDMRPLVPAGVADRFTDENHRAAFVGVFRDFIWRIPGKSWANTAAHAERLGVPGVIEAG